MGTGPQSKHDEPPFEERTQSGDPVRVTFGAVYEDLRRLAAGYIRQERPDHTLQATDLVHEACLRLAPALHDDGATRGRLIGYVARVMRQVLVDHARRAMAVKRGAGDKQGLQRISISGVAKDEATRGVALDSLAQALAWLEKEDKDLAQLIEWHYLAGMTGQQIADRQNVSRATINRELALARALLLAEIDRIEGNRP